MKNPRQENPGFIRCTVIPRPDATPRQLQALGAALHRWYRQEYREHGMALYTNEEATRALLDGLWPPPDSPKRKTAHRATVPLEVRGGRSYNREATIASLRKAIPAGLVEDVFIDGRSWRRGGAPLMRARRLPYGNLMIPVIAEGSGEVEVFTEIGPEHPDYPQWLLFSEDGEDPRPRKGK